MFENSWLIKIFRGVDSNKRRKFLCTFGRVSVDCVTMGKGFTYMYVIEV